MPKIDLSLDEKVDLLLSDMEEIKSRLPPAIASKSEIEGKYGDPRVNFDPKQWGGASFRGMSASACTADFCDCYAETLEYMARNPKEGSDPKFIVYNKKDARLFRRWALSLRESFPVPHPTQLKKERQQQEAPPIDDDSKVPF